MKGIQNGKVLLDEMTITMNSKAMQALNFIYEMRDIVHHRVVRQSLYYSMNSDKKIYLNFKE